MLVFMNHLYFDIWNWEFRQDKKFWSY